MRAISFLNSALDASATAIRELPDPTPEPGQVLITVDYAGINYIDVMARRGDPGYASSWPYVPGHEVSGTVTGVGSTNSPFAPGDRVAAFTGGGGLAEKVVANELLVAKIPAEVDGTLAAAAPLMLATAILLLKDAARFRPGDTILMHAAGGGVGSAVAQLVPALGGGRLIGTVADAGKTASALAAGWQDIVVRDERLEPNIKALAPGGIDVVLDPLGTQLLSLDIAVAAPAARIVVFGNPGGHALESLPPVGALIGGNLSIGGFSISRLVTRAPERIAAALAEGLELIASKQIALPVSVFDGLQSVADAHTRLAEGRSAGKYVVKIS